MDSFLNLIGSIVIGGLFLFGVLNYQSDMKQHSFEYSNEMMLQHTAMNTIEILEWDLRHIGYGINFPPLSVFALDSITFYADLFDDGIIDTVNYRVGPVSETPGTTNPRDRIFDRWSNSEPEIDAALGVTNFKLVFFDASGDTTENQTEIRTIEVTLELEGTEPYYDKVTNEPRYAQFYWREKITPMNLQP